MIRRFGPWPVLALLLSIAFPVDRVHADQIEAGAQICERAIIAGARRAGVPQDVLHAISLTETGRAQGGRLRPWPWAINREGKGFWFKNREEALAFAKASLAEGRRSFDVGLLPDQLSLARHELPLARGDVRPGHRRRLCRAVPAEPLWRARQLVGGGRGLSLADAVAGERLPGALRPDLRGPRRRAAADRGGGAGGGRARGAAEAAKPRKSRTRLSRGPKIITIAPETGKVEAPTEEAVLRKRDIDDAASRNGSVVADLVY